MRLRNNGSYVSPTSLLQILIREMGKGRRATEKIGKKQESRKAGIVTTRIQQRSRCKTFQRSEAEAAGRRGESSSVAGLGQQAGSRKKSKSQSRRKQQDSGSRPRRVLQHAGIP